MTLNWIDIEPPEKSTLWPTNRSFRATWQIRCADCGRFAKVLRSWNGRPDYWGEYDPWWVVDCKRCGETDGMSGEQ